MSSSSSLLSYSSWSLCSLTNLLPYIWSYVSVPAHFLWSLPSTERNMWFFSCRICLCALQCSGKEQRGFSRFLTENNCKCCLKMAQTEWWERAKIVKLWLGQLNKELKPATTLCKTRRSCRLIHSLVCEDEAMSLKLTHSLSIDCVDLWTNSQCRINVSFLNWRNALTITHINTVSGFMSFLWGLGSIGNEQLVHVEMRLSCKEWCTVQCSYLLPVLCELLQHYNLVL